jgi:hypothetical protein
MTHDFPRRPFGGLQDLTQPVLVHRTAEVQIREMSSSAVDGYGNVAFIASLLFGVFTRSLRVLFSHRMH